MNFIGYDPAKNEKDRTGWFGIDPKLHVAVAGKTRTGKSTLLTNLALDLINEGSGIVIGDPHGPFVAGVDDAVPPHLKSKIFRFSFRERYPLNFYATDNKDEWHLRIDEGWSLISRTFYQNFSAPESKNIYENQIKAQYEACPITWEGETYNYPNFVLCAKMLMEKELRQLIVSRVKDDVVKAFWLQYDDDKDGWNARMRSEKSAPILNKYLRFTDGHLREMFGSNECMDFRRLMDNARIVLLDLSKSEWGEETSRFLGGVLGFLHQQAALSRQDILKWNNTHSKDERKPLIPSFGIWDEFASFSMNVKTYFAECGKYFTFAILAFQTSEVLDADIRANVLGNCSTYIVYRVSNADAVLFSQEFAGDIEIPPKALKGLDNYHCYVQTVIEGRPQPPRKLRAFRPK